MERQTRSKGASAVTEGEGTADTLELKKFDAEIKLKEAESRRQDEELKLKREEMLKLDKFKEEELNSEEKKCADRMRVRTDRMRTKRKNYGLRQSSYN